MRLGRGPRRSVVILWLWTALLSATALVPTYTGRGNALVPVALVALALLLYVYFHPGVRGRARPSRAANAGVIELSTRRRSRAARSDEGPEREAGTDR